MATYDHKQVLADYEQGKLSPERAVGHSLQHIDKLYEMHSTTRYAWQTKLDALETRVHTLQAAVDRLTAIIEKARAKQKRPSPSQPKADQP